MSCTFSFSGPESLDNALLTFNFSHINFKLSKNELRSSKTYEFSYVALSLLPKIYSSIMINHYFKICIHQKLSESLDVNYRTT